MPISRTFLFGALATAAIGCGKQDGALPASNIDAPSSPSQPSSPSSTPATRGEGEEDGRKSALAQPAAGTPFFHGTWVSETGWSQPTRRGRSESRGSKARAKSESAANAAAPPKMAPEIRQMLRSISIALRSDGTIRLEANGAVHAGRYSVDSMSKTTARIKARYESGIMAATDVFTVNFEGRNARGRARLRLEAGDGDSAPLMLVESEMPAQP